MTDADDLEGQVAYAAEIAGRFGADVVVVDHYRAGRAEEDRLRDPSRRIVAIDDLADRRHACDLLVDPGYGRRREHYDGLIDDACAVRLGPSHALVRPEFAAARQRAMSRRAKHGPARRALVSLGLTDVGGVTGRVVRALAPLLGDTRLDIVLGDGAPSLPALSAMAERDRRLHLWIDNAEMASLMADADVAIGAGGSSVWERATVGLPSATLVLADNQRAMIEHMAGAGFTLAVDVAEPDFEPRLRERWSRLIDDRQLRWDLSARSSELCDSRGAERVAEAMMDLLRQPAESAP
jgi:UDP-2,4-diacetamido-2,4,6-trideoxy-beta-L-altropyranose hydrolase